MAFCENCGAQLNAASKFCPECGHEVAARSAGQAPAATAAHEAGAATTLTMHDVQAPAASGEAVLSAWESAGPADAPTQVAVQVSPVDSAEGASGQAYQASVQPAPQASAGAAQPRQKSKLPLIIGAVAALALATFLGLYIVPLFIPHPHDPNSRIALTSDPSQTEPTADPGTSETPPDDAVSDPTPEEESNPSAEAESSEPSSEPASSEEGAPETFSTNERPVISEFGWLTGEAAKGNVPAGATRMVDFGACMGGWKCYMYDADMEWLANALIDAGQEGAVFDIDWYYKRIGGSGDGQEDATPTSTFTGSFDGGMLDVVGPGRVTITAFWEQDGRQYATGSFVWPSGEVSNIALVRP